MTMLRLRTDRVEWRTLEGRIIAVDLRTREVLETNRAGALMWNALIEGATREALLKELQTAYDLTAERAGEDADAFLTMIGNADLLDEEAAAG